MEQNHTKNNGLRGETGEIGCSWQVKSLRSVPEQQVKNKEG